MAELISRRKLGIAAIASAALAQTGSAATTYGGALDGVENKINLSEFDPVAWTMERYKSAPLRLTFRASTASETEDWQHQLRTKLTELVGGFPDERSPLMARTLEVREYPGYRREKLVFESRPGVGVLAYLLTPKAKPTPYATVVCVPGHGRGADDIVGIDEHGNDRTDKSGYQHDFAIQAVEHGFAALAIEPMAFGCRRDARTSQHGLSATACQPTAGSALQFGETMIGWRVWDTMRAIDYIETRPNLDAKRVGVMGISGGGTCTLFSAALDQRVQFAYVSGYLNTFRDSIMSLSHCMDNYIPGILNWAEQYDVAGLIAPRYLFSEAGDRDPIFPVHASRESFARVKKVYDVLDASDHCAQEVFSGVHEFHGAQGFPFMVRALA